MLKPILLSIAITFSFVVTCYAQTVKQYEAHGDSLVNKEQYLAAVESFTNAIKLNKDNSKHLSVLYDKRGDAYYELKKYPKALDDENEALKLDNKNGDAYWHRGLDFFNLKKYEQAIADYTAAMPYNKNNFDNLSILYKNRGNVKYKLKLYDDALKDDSVAISLNNKNGDAYWDRGVVYHALNKYQLSNNDYKIALQYEDDKYDLATLYNNMASNSRALKDYKNAIEYESSAITFNPDNGGYYWDRGAAYQNNKDYQFALDDFDKAIPYFKNENGALAILHNNKAYSYIYLDNPELSVKENDIALSLDPKLKFGYITRGIIKGKVGDHAAAAAFKQAITLYKEQQDMVKNLYSDWVNEKFYTTPADQLLKYCDTAAQLNPAKYYPYYTRGKVYLKKLKDVAKASADFEMVLKLDTTHNSVSYIFAQLYLGKIDTAISLSKKQILDAKDDRDLSLAYYNMACLYSLILKKDDAINYLKFAFEKGYNKKYAVADDDFDNIRETQEFKRLVTN